MGQILKSRYDANEVAKSEDFIHGETREIENLSTLLEYLLKPSAKDVIVTGGTVRERSSPSMNVDIDSILAFIKSSGKFIHTGSTLGPVAITDGGAQDRIDTLEVRYVETTYDSQQRAYKDPTTGGVSYQDFDTKTRYEMEAQVILGTEGAGVAPDHTAGWIKLAEIAVDTGETTSILDADIENCTGGKDSEATTNWTAETDATFRLESLSDIKTKFRLGHKEDGDHSDDFVEGRHVDWGTGSEQVDADLLPLGTNITHAPTGGTAAGLLSTHKVRAAIQKILDLLIDLSGVQNDAVVNRHIGPNAVRASEVDLGVDTGDVDADVLPLGTAVTSSPAGGTATNLANSSFVRAALQVILDRLKDLSGVQNDAVDSRHYAANSIDEEHINWGVSVNADDLPILDAGSRYAAQQVEAALQEIAGSGRGSETVKGNADNIGPLIPLRLFKGFMSVALTNYTGTGQPAIVASCGAEINGSFYINPSEVAITGSTSNSTWYDILLTPSGSTFTASFIARGTGVWSDSKQGIYSGNNRVVACVYKDGSGNFINKNVLIVANRTIKIGMEIGDWDMQAGVRLTITEAKLGIDTTKIRIVNVLIRHDDGLVCNLETGHLNNASVAGRWWIDTGTSLVLDRVTGGSFNSVNFDSTSYNRGWIAIEYEV